MVAIVMLHHKHMKQFKPFIPHVIAWSVRKGFNQSIRRTENEIAMFRLSDAEICNAKTPHHKFRRYEKRKASMKKKRV